MLNPKHFYSFPAGIVAAKWQNVLQILGQGRKHAARRRRPHMALKDILCGTRCFLGIFK